MWLLYAQTREQNPETPADNRVGEMLRRIEAALDAAHNEKPRFEPRLVVDHSVWQSAVASPAEVEKAQQLYLRVWEQDGSRASYILDHLADLIALARQPVSISFWQSLLDLKKPRDRHKQQRISTAIAALVLLAMQDKEQDKDSAAEEALLDALYHRESAVRASACFYLVMFYDLVDIPVADEALTALRDCALSGKAYEPRYQARLALWFLDRPLPLENSGGTYLLKVRLRHDRSPRMRRLALRSEQTLFDLHVAIQRAFAWDSDHLYSFYMNNKTGDEHYEIGLPEDDSWGDDLLLAFGNQLFATDDRNSTDSPIEVWAEELAEDADEAGQEPADDEEEWSVYSVHLGDLGLLPKHKFSYLFDFGDHHEFEITVEAVKLQADDGEYPRLLESVGDAPPQYRHSDFDDDDDDWDEDDNY